MPYRIVNLDDRQVLQPDLLAEGNSFSAVVTNAPVMGGLIHLISEGGPWHSKHVALVSPDTGDGEVPNSLGLTNMSSSMLYSPSSAGRERFTHVSKVTREALAEFYGYTFVMQRSSVTTVDENGANTTKAVSTIARRPDLDPETLDYYLTMGPQDVVIVNLDKLEMLDPQLMGNTGALADLVIDPDDGMTPVILAALLHAGRFPDSTTASLEDRLGSTRVGSWAGDRLAVLDRTDPLILSEELSVIALSPQVQVDADGNETTAA